MKLPPWSKLVRFADDIAATVRARNEKQAQQRVKTVTVLVEDWLKSHGLELAASKTKVVFPSRHRHFSPNSRMQISSEFVVARDTVKYLVEFVDRKLTNWAHIGTRLVDSRLTSTGQSRAR